MSTTLTKAGLAGAAALGCALALAPAVPASAATPPSCLKVSIDDNKRSDTVEVYNGCDRGYQVKVVWAYETDDCQYASAGFTTVRSTRDYPARFDGLEFC